MPTLLTLPAITTALTAQVGGTWQFKDEGPRNLAVQFNFVYGSSGTSVDAYLQTTFDEGVSWCDIAQFHATTASLRRLYNLSSLTPIASIATPSDGSLTANTAVDGLIGSKLRVKYTTVGTYAGATSLNVDVATARMFSP